jgi:hypothetical protein
MAVRESLNCQHTGFVSQGGRIPGFPRQRGFALVVTLSLMILLTIISVGLLSLSSISLRSAGQTKAMAEAKNNARFALLIALGELQKHAGPDQRVTARAEILDGNPATPAMDDVNQPYWTAAWKTGEAPLDAGASPQRKISLGAASPSIADKAASGQWLVSNPNPGGSAPPNPTNYNGASTGATPLAVVVAKNQGKTPLDIAVPLVNVLGPGATKPSGRYGYWVSDEGLKAKVNLVDPTLAAAPKSQLGQAHLLAPQANAIHKITGLMADAGKDFRSENTAAQLGNSITTQTVSLLPTSPADLPLEKFLPDVTAYSRGVLADVKRGGLKKDLTAAFESTDGFEKLTTGNPDPNLDYGFGKKTLYRNFPGLTVPYSTAMQAGASTYEGITDGLPWAALHAYYNIYKDVMPKPAGLTTADSAITPGSTGSMSSLPYDVTPRVVTIKEPVAGGFTSGKYGGLVPEIISHRTDIALESYPQLEGASTKWKLRLRYAPQLVLHNPYSCRISTAGFQVERRYRAFMDWSSGGAGTYKITVKVGGTVVATNVIVAQAPYNNAQRYALRTKAGECDSLAPGETRVFGLTADVPKSNPEQAITFAELTSAPGLTKDFAQYCDLPVSTSVDVVPAVPPSTTPGYKYTNGAAWEGTTDASALVELPLALNPAFKQLSAGEADTFMTPENKWPSQFPGNRVFNTSGPQVDIPAPTTWPALPISSLVQPRIVSGFFIRKKGLKPSSSSKTYVNGGAVIPPFHGNAPFFTPFDNMLGVAWEEFYINPFGSPYTSASDVEMFQKTPGGKWETFVGGASVGVAANAGPARTVLRDVPNQPLISMGQFMHMPTMVFANHNDAMTNYGYFKYGFRDTGSMFIGGSLANPFIDTNSNLLEQATPVFTHLLYDDSFLANDTLFDRFYFSTVPPAGVNKYTPRVPQQWKDFSAANPGASLTKATALPNARIKPYEKEGTAPQMSDLRDFNKAAANLMLDGAFNVNSTSIPAWTALLSSLSGNDMRVFTSTAGNQDTIAAAALRNPIPRFWSSSVEGKVNQAWEGNRALSDDEVTELATRIVEQVKTRGPFLSMADFLNRRLGTAGPLTRVGCLQAAIDTTSPDINASVKSSGETVNATGSGMPMSGFPPYNLPPVITDNLKDGAGNPLNSTAGMPGYLMQQDIVQAFSPAMTVRSDTFVIRTFGESLNPTTGLSQAKAWAEAVVQRVPEFVDSTADPDPTTAIASLSSTINQNLGRRFKVIGFRWLSSNEL